MLAAAAKPFVNLVEKYLPDPFVFVLALTFVVIGAAVMLQQQPVTSRRRMLAAAKAAHPWVSSRF